MGNARSNPLVREALELQQFGVTNEDGSFTILDDDLASHLTTVVLAANVARDDTANEADMLEKARQVGLEADDLVEKTVPGFLARTVLSEDEERLLRENPEAHPELELRKDAVSVIRTLVNGTFCKTGTTGRVQEKCLSKGQVLIEAKVPVEPGKARTKVVKLTTDDIKLVTTWYVSPRGAKVVKVAGTAKDDLVIVNACIPDLSDEMRRVMGMHLTNAVTQALVVADPNWTGMIPAAKRRALVLEWSAADKKQK